MKFESGRGSKKTIKMKTSFESWKIYFSFYLFFITHFPLHFKYDF